MAADADTLRTWWRSWAPYWDLMEDRHFDAGVAASHAGVIEGPALVTGAGQGLIVEHLERRGCEAIGLDLDRDMVSAGSRRGRKGLMAGDARHLPFASRSFRTVIVSSGVVDYASDEAMIGEVLSESMRVLQPHGYLLAGFYAFQPALERIYRRMGILVGDTYHSGRSTEIYRGIKSSPTGCGRKIAAWTGKSYARSLAYFTWLGISRPAVLIEEDRVVSSILERASKDGVEPGTLLDSIPGSIPFRDVQAVRTLLARAGLAPVEITRHDDCIVAVHRKAVPGRHGAGEEPSRGSPGRAGGGGGWVLRAEGLVKSYGRSRARAVDSLDLTVERGTITGLLGPNGAGKTTTLSMISGLVRPDAGRVAMAPGLARTIRQAIGLVPQELAVYPWLTGRENLEFFGRLHGVSGKALAGRVDSLLAMVGLADRAADLVRTYSTGMTRRLNLAAGLVHDPPLLLLDEPTVGIDPQSRNCIYESIMEARSRGVAIIHTTHYMDEAARLCDRVAIMDNGRIILEGPPADLVERHGVTRMDFDEDGGGRGLADEIESLELVTGTATGRGTLAVFLPGTSRSMEVVEAAARIAARRGATLRLRAVTRPDLESLFLDLTGRGLKDGADARERA